jgi:hypothetical protein
MFPHGNDAVFLGIPQELKRHFTDGLGENLNTREIGRLREDGLVGIGRDTEEFIEVI